MKAKEERDEKADGEKGVSPHRAEKLSTRGRKSEGRPAGGRSQAARDLGLTEDKVRRAEKIDSICQEAKDTASGAKLSQKALLGRPA
jgi:hypothetical protein